MKRKLEDEVTIVFKNNEGKTEQLTITIRQLLDRTAEDLHEMLEDNVPCSCINEGQNFCECNPYFEDYEIVELIF
jgi:hypothetical protein